MPPCDTVKIACEACRSRRRKCIPTAGAKCENCTKQNLTCVVSPPTEEQREARRDSGRHNSSRSNIEMHSDSEASFDSLFDESKSEPDALTRKIGIQPLQTKHISSTVVVDRQKTAETTRKRPAERKATSSTAQPGYESDSSADTPADKKQRFTTPSPSTFKPTTSQRIPVSPAPLAKMVPTQRYLPKLSTPQSVVIPVTRSQARDKSPLTSTTLTPSSARSSKSQLENTKLKVYLHGSKGYRPLLLKDCMAPSLFFAKMIETWSLPDDIVKRLDVTFPWLPKDGRLMILERQNIKAGMICICDEAESAPCWTEGSGRCSIDVTIIPNMQFTKDRSKGPTTGDGRSIPDMSVNANRVYWAMRADKRADAGLHVGEIFKMMGMDPADFVVAGNELMEHCLIFTSDRDYDVWSLLEI